VDLYDRTGVRAIALFSRGNVDDPALPYSTDSDGALGFFIEELGFSSLDVIRRFETWSVSQDEGNCSAIYYGVLDLTVLNRCTREQRVRRHVQGGV
jgi:hypothetical protein